MKKPPAWRLAVLLAVLAAGTTALLLRRQNSGRVEVGIPSTLAIDAGPAFDLGAMPIHLQGDPRWGGELLGGSGEPLRAAGCVVCCLSMALAHHGVEIDPGALNRELTRLDGFTPRGWVKWEALEPASGGKARVRIPDEPTSDNILDALRARNPVIVKVMLRSGVPHWVLVVGWRGTDYLVRDPLGAGMRLECLSKFGSDMLAVRVVERVR